MYIYIYINIYVYSYTYIYCLLPSAHCILPIAYCLLPVSIPTGSNINQSNDRQRNGLVRSGIPTSVDARCRPHPRKDTHIAVSEIGKR